MNLKITIVLLLLFFSTHSQNQQWVSYSNKQSVNCIEMDGTNVWLGTNGGIIVLDGNGNKLTEYTYGTGLSCNYITAMCFGKDGKKWFGTTDGGVNVYDGVSWKSYNTKNSGLKSNFVTSIAIDLQGNKWFSSSMGVCKFDGTNWINYDEYNTGHSTNVPNSGLYNKAINDLKVDLQGNLWLATQWGISKFNGISWETLPGLNTAISSMAYSSITIEPSGNIWFGGDKGITLFNGSTWVSYGFPSNLINTVPRSIASDSQGKLYIGISEKGFYQFSGGNWTDLKTLCPTLLPNYYCPVKQKNGDIWFGGNALTLFKNNNWNSFQTPSNETPAKEFTCMVIDKAGNKWMGTPSGLYKFDGKTWKIFTKADYGNGLYTSGNPNSIKGLSLDENGDVFVKTENSVFVYNGQTWRDDSLFYRATDKNGNKWFEKGYNHLTKKTGNTFVDYTPTNSGMPNDFVVINDIIPDELGNIWIGSFKGLTKFDGTNWITFFPSGIPNLKKNYIYSLLLDKQNIFWAGTQDGVYKYNGTTWQLINNITMGIDYNDGVLSSVIDIQGNKWFASAAGYVLKYNDKVWQKFQPFPGVATLNLQFITNYIHNVRVDSIGHVWFAIESGYGGVAEFLGNGGNTPQTKSIIKGKIFFDKNQNLIKDPLENYLPNKKVILLPDSIYGFSDLYGNYQFEVDTGKVYKVNTLSQSYWMPTTVGSNSIYMHAKDTVLPDYGYYAPDTLSISSTTELLTRRCNTISPCWFTFSNTGTITDTGIVMLQFDQSLSFVNSAPVHDSIRGNKIYFHYINFKPGNINQLILNFKMPDFSHAGDTIAFNTEINSKTDKQFKTTFKKILSCAFDPNIKEVKTVDGTIGDYVFNHQELSYTIQFQNTGNDTAYHIRIQDTLSKFIDEKSFQLTSSSHPCQVSLDTNRTLGFHFNHIMLPDSTTNEPKSHGFLSYKVKLKPNLNPGTKINNLAGIYFDLNPPVITNTTQSVIVSPKSVIIDSIYICNGDSVYFHNQYHKNYKEFSDTIKINPSIYFVKKTILSVRKLPSIVVDGYPIGLKNCLGEQIMLTVKGANSYKWSDGISPNVYFNPASSANSYVVGTDKYGCKDTTHFKILVNDLPKITISSDAMAAGSQGFNVCKGSSLTLTASGAKSYSWSDGIINAVPFIPNANKINFVYYYTATDSNACIVKGKINVDVLSLPTVVLNIQGRDSMCNTQSLFTLSGGFPSSGTYFSQGNYSPVFDPAIANSGWNKILFSYTDNYTNCTNYAEDSLYVYGCTGVIQNNSNAGISIHLGNTLGNYFIQNYSSQKIDKILVWDILGQLILQSNSINNSNYELELGSYIKGIYYIELIGESGKMGFKIFKE